MPPPTAPQRSLARMCAARRDQGPRQADSGITHRYRSSHSRRVHHQILERSGERAVVASPRHGRDRRSAVGAVDPAGDRHDLDHREPSTEMPPRPDAVTVVEPRSELATTPTPSPPMHLCAISESRDQLRTDMHHQSRPAASNHFDPDDHDIAGEPTDRLEYLVDADAVRSSLPFLRQLGSYGPACAPTSAPHPTPDCVS